MIFSDEMKIEYGKALNNRTIFWIPIKAEELIKYGLKELSDLIVEMNRMKKRLKDGTLTIEDLIKGTEFRMLVVDKAMEWKLNLDKEMDRAREAAAMEPGDDTEVRNEMLKKLKGNLEVLSNEQIKEMLSNLDD